MFNFNNQVVIVTGGSRGIGAETVRLFSELGANVAFNYYKEREEAENTRSEIEKTGQQCLIMKADMAKRSDCKKLVDATVKEFGRIDVLVNNAGIWTEAAIENMTDEVLDRTLDINLKGSFYTTTAAVPYMKKRQSGTIIFVASTAGQRGEAWHSHYAATKGALISLTKSLAVELASSNIRVNCVAPGWVDTDMSHPILISPEGPKHLGLIPLERAANAREIARPIVFIASEWASFITGEILNVNGGAVLVG